MPPRNPPTRRPLTEATLNEYLRSICLDPEHAGALPAAGRDWKGVLAAHFHLTPQQHASVNRLSREAQQRIEQTIRDAQAHGAGRALVQVRFLTRADTPATRHGQEMAVVGGAIDQGRFTPTDVRDRDLEDARTLATAIIAGAIFLYYAVFFDGLCNG